MKIINLFLFLFLISFVSATVFIDIPEQGDVTVTILNNGTDTNASNCGNVGDVLMGSNGGCKDLNQSIDDRFSIVGDTNETERVNVINQTIVDSNESWLSTFNATYDALVGGGINNNTNGWNISFNSIFSFDWSNITIFQSQILDLTHFNFTYDSWLSNATTNWTERTRLTYNETWSSTFNSTYDALIGGGINNNTNGWNISFNSIFSFDWSNITILASQILDLTFFNVTYDNYQTNVSTNYTERTRATYNETWSSTFNATYDANVDTNESSRFINLVNTDCASGNYTFGVWENGTIKCRDDLQGSGGTGNPFDQSLNKSDNVTFYQINSTSGWDNVTITESQVTDLTHTIDTNISEWKDNVTSSACTAGQKVIAIQTNGSVTCEPDATGEGGKSASGTYIYNDSVIIYSNDTALNYSFNQTPVLDIFELNVSTNYTERTRSTYNETWSSTFNSTYDALIGGVTNNSIGWNISFNSIFSFDWSNITIFQSQIVDLIHIGKDTSGDYIFNDSSIIFSNDTRLNNSFNQTPLIESVNASLISINNSDNIDALGFLNKSGTNADQNIDIGIYNFTTSYISGKTLDPSAPDDLVNKHYVDLATASTAFDFFFTNDSSDIGNHFNMTESHLGNPESELTTSSLGIGTFSIFNWTTLIGQPEFNELRQGTYDIHVHLSHTGTRDVVVTPKLYNISSDGSVRTLIMTFETTSLITDTPTEYELHGVLSSPIILPADNRLNLELETTVSGGGGNVVISVLMEGTTDSHLTIETSSDAFEKIFIRQDGTINLTGNWNQGIFNLTNVNSWWLGFLNWTSLKNIPAFVRNYTDEIESVNDTIFVVNDSLTAINITLDNKITSTNDTLTAVNISLTDQVNSVNNSVEANNETTNIEALGFTQGPHTIDSNETPRFDNLTLLNCPGTDKSIGVYANGTIECGEDLNTGVGNTSQEIRDAVNDSIEYVFTANKTIWFAGANSTNGTQFNLNIGRFSIDISWLTNFLNTWFGTKDTDDLSEGSTNKYEDGRRDNATVDSRLDVINNSVEANNETTNIEALGFTQGVHTVDTNVTTACTTDHVLLGNGSCMSSSVFISSGGGNPFDQSLNVSDNVTHYNINVTGNLHVEFNFSINDSVFYENGTYIIWD